MNPSNKTGEEDLQELIEEIPYPTEDLSLTSFSNSSSNTNALKRPKQPIEQQKAFYTSFGSENKETIINKTPIHIKFERYQSQHQKEEDSFDDDDELSNLPNFESLTPHRINQIMDWSKQHVTPGDSKHIFPQVIAPSIEFSHETSAYLSKCVLIEQNQMNNEQFEENFREKKGFNERNREKGYHERKNEENLNEKLANMNLIKKFEEKNNKYEEKSQRFDNKSQQNFDEKKSQQNCEENSQRFGENCEKNSQKFVENCEENSQRNNSHQNFEGNNDKISQRFDEKPPEMNPKFSESQQRVEIDRLRLFCERLESQTRHKDNILHKKEQETYSLIERIRELEEEIELLRESTHENSNLELLRGRNLELSRKEVKNLKKEIEQKQGFINEIMKENEDLKQDEMGFQESVEKEMSFLHGEIEKFKTLSIGYKRKATENENQFKQMLDQKEIENTDFERKIDAISQGYEEISIENQALKDKNKMILGENELFKKKIKEFEGEIANLREQNSVLKAKEELIYEGNINEINDSKEKPILEKDLHEEIDRMRKINEKIVKEFEEYRNLQPKEEENTRISMNKLILTEASFGRNESKGILMGICEHKSQLECFFVEIGYKEEGVDGLENKSFEDLIGLLHSIFNHLQEQFEVLYNERNEMSENLNNLLEKTQQKTEKTEENEEFIKEKEELMREIKGNKEEIQRIQQVLSQKMAENLGLKEIIQRQKDDLLKKNEDLEVLQVKQKAENSEVFIRNSESFQVISAKLEETNEKLQEINQKYTENCEKYNEITKEYRELSQKFNEISQKFNEISQKNSENTKEKELFLKKIEFLTKENELFIKEKAEKISQQSTEISQKNADFEVLNRQKCEISSLKAEISQLKVEKNTTKSENSFLKAGLDNERTVSETHRAKAFDYGKQLEILSIENEDLRDLLHQQGEKIEELTKLIDEDLESKAKFEDLQIETKEFTDKIEEIREENYMLKEEISVKNKGLQEIKTENELFRKEINKKNQENEGFKEEIMIKKQEITGFKAKIEEFSSEIERFKQEIMIKNDRLRTNEENNDILKEKDKKNIQLFKENKLLSENLKVLEEANIQNKLELEKKTKFLAQKIQDIKTLSQNLKEKNEELSQEKERKIQFEEASKGKNDTKVLKDKENMIKITNKVRQNDEEFKEMKRLFMNEKDRLLQHIREIEILKEKTSQEKDFLIESNQISKEKINFLEKALKEKYENTINKRNSKGFWCPEMLSNEETIEMMLELLRRIIGSNVILNGLNEQEEIVVLLKKLMMNMRRGGSLENSKIMRNFH